MSEVLLHYTRAGKVESVHRGDIVAVNTKGEIVYSVGDAKKPMFWRSAAKPFQALPFVRGGGVEQYGITEEELAFLISSHNGEEKHVELARSIFEKIGVTEDALECGVMRPSYRKAAAKLTAAGIKPTAIHNQCSGKHSGMLALCQLMGVPTPGYISPEHPAQKEMHEAVAYASDMNPEELEIGIDGCGVPVFYLPLDHMAYAYARLAKPEEGNWGEYEEGARKIRDAMVNQPFAVAGSKRIDTAIMEITKGRILAKVGAEAVYCLANLEEGVGLTFKIEDGSYRAINPVVLGSLKAMNWLTDEEYAQLEAQFPPVLKNHRGDVIGSIEVMFK